jgi:hypothetical protein
MAPLSLDTVLPKAPETTPAAAKDPAPAAAG